MIYKVPQKSQKTVISVENTNFITLISSEDKKLDLSGEKITIISSNALKNVSGLEQIILPEKLETIKEYAFENCQDLKIVSLEAKIENNISNLLIQSNAFVDCKNLDSVHIKCNKLTLEKDAFAGCYKLRIVYLECKELDFRQNAFSNSPELTIFGQKQYFAPSNPQKKSFDLEDFCKRDNIKFNGV